MMYTGNQLDALHANQLCTVLDLQGSTPGSMPWGQGGPL